MATPKRLLPAAILLIGCMMVTHVVGAEATDSATSVTHIAVPRAEHPRPDFLRDSWMNLNGTWDFEIDAGLSGEERGLQTGAPLSRKITVPFCPESELSGINNKDFMPAVWYRRAVRIPADWKGQRVLLHIGACDYDTTVWVNGKRAGTHRGGYTSFMFDITFHMTEGDNSIVVRAVDDTRSPLQPKGKQCPQFKSFGCHYTRTTGIWQTVWLEAVPRSYISSIRCFPNPDQKRVSFRVSTHGAITGGKVSAVVSVEGRKVASAEAKASQGTDISVSLPEFTLWEPGKPYLYDVEFTLTGVGAPDKVRSYFGMRDIAIDRQKVLINGKSVFQRLVLDQGFYPDGIYTAKTDADLKKDIELSLAMGFNGARLHEKVFEPRFLYWADKLGYLVWGEYPNWGLDHSNSQALERVLPEWMEAIERDFNHPSIIGWCPFNETPTNQNSELIRTIYRVTKATDPTRPVIDTSGYVHVETDIYDSHNYEQDPAKFATAFDDFKTTGEPYRNFPQHDIPYGGQPYFVSEYGGIWWAVGNEAKDSWGYGERPKNADEMLTRFRKLTEYLLEHPRMFAFCYTQLYDVEQEQNGLYTYDRKPKFDPSIIKEINNQKAAIEK